VEDRPDKNEVKILEKSGKVFEDIIHFLDEDSENEKRLLDRFQGCSAESGDVFYSHLLKVLVHLDFPPAEAREHWNQILSHKAGMEKGLSRPIGFRVALLDYFININRKVKNPKIVEIALFEQTVRSAITDSLTGLYNKRYFIDAAEKEIKRSKRYRSNASILFFDLDNFKEYNDVNGHIAGDIALKEVANIFSASCRMSDTVARYGGEEFSILLPETDKKSAGILAERIRKAVEEYAFEGEQDLSSEHLTISGGVASFPGDGDDWEEIMRNADEALYMAKNFTKNRVCLFFSERRNFPRIERSYILSYRVVSPDETGPEQVTVTKNISESGISFECEEQLHLSDVINLKIKVPGLEQVLEVMGTIVRAEKLERGNRYAVGMQFLNINKNTRNLLRTLVT